MTRFLQDNLQSEALIKVGELLANAAITEHEFMPQLNITFSDKQNLENFMAAMDEAVTARCLMPLDGFERDDTAHGLGETFLRYTSLLPENETTITVSFGANAHNTMTTIKEQADIVRSSTSGLSL